MLQLKFSPLPVIKTKRVVLRKIKLSDAPEMFFMRSDKVVLKYIDRAPDQSIEDTRNHIRFLHSLEKATNRQLGLLPKTERIS